MVERDTQETTAIPEAGECREDQEIPVNEERTESKVLTEVKDRPETSGHPEDPDWTGPREPREVRVTPVKVLVVPPEMLEHLVLLASSENLD